METFTVVGTNWCGYTHKLLDSVESSTHSDLFTYVDCSKTPDDEKCTAVNAFPVVKSQSGEICHRGFTDDINEIVIKCSTWEQVQCAADK